MYYHYSSTVQGTKFAPIFLGKRTLVLLGNGAGNKSFWKCQELKFHSLAKLVLKINHYPVVYLFYVI